MFDDGWEGLFCFNYGQSLKKSQQFNACDAWFALFLLWNMHFTFVLIPRCCFNCNWYLFLQTLLKFVKKETQNVHYGYTIVRDAATKGNLCWYLYLPSFILWLCCTCVLKMCIYSFYYLWHSIHFLYLLRLLSLTPPYPSILR